MANNSHKEVCMHNYTAKLSSINQEAAISDFREHQQLRNKHIIDKEISCENKMNVY